MIFRTTAYLTCGECGVRKVFVAESDVVAAKFSDSKDIKMWKDIGLFPLDFKGTCPECLSKHKE